MMEGRQYLLESSRDLFSSLPSIPKVLAVSPTLFNLKKRLSIEGREVEEQAKPWLSVLSRSPSNRSSRSPSSTPSWSPPETAASRGTSPSMAADHSNSIVSAHQIAVTCV